MIKTRSILFLTTINLLAVFRHQSNARTLFATSKTFGDENGPFATVSEHKNPNLVPSLPAIMAFMREHSSRERNIAIATKKKATTRKKTIRPMSKITPIPIVVRQNVESSNNDTNNTAILAMNRNNSRSKSDQQKGALITYERIPSDPVEGEFSEKRREQFMKKVQNVPIKDDHAMELFQHWTDQAFSNLFAMVANQKLKEFEKPVHDEFGECSHRAKTVPMHAKCVSDLIRGKISGAKFYSEARIKSNRFDRYRMKKKGEFRRKIGNITKYNDWIGSFRMMDSPISLAEEAKNNRKLMSPQKHLVNLYDSHRRERRQTGIVKKNYYELLTPSAERISPMGQIAKMMMKQVLKTKGKEEKDVKSWQSTVQKIATSAKRRKAIKKQLGEEPVESIDQLTYRGLKRQGVVKDDLNDVLENPKKLKSFLMQKQTEKGKAPIDRFVRLLREGLKLGYMAAGKNTTDFDQKTLKMASPRFLSVMPEQDSEQNETIDFLSPSLFSLHNTGNGVENLTSIPNILHNVGGPMGFSAKDQQLWLDFIMEAAGVVEDADRIESELNETSAGEDPLKAVWAKHFDKERYEREIRTKDGTPLYFTKQNISDAFGPKEVRKVDMFEDLQKMMNKDQVKDMNKTGFALMSKQQLDKLYGPNSEYHDDELIKKFASMNRSSLLQHIERDIHSLAQIKSFKITRKESKQNRAKRAVILSPISFSPFILTFLNANPIILSPIIFSPLILSPAVLGPVILSPWAFVPVILSPRLLSPLILSPPIFAPVILSPLALHPIILSPGVFIPFVLSPVLMTPFILSPQVFTPFILSPFALSPFILNPAVASPIVLSPFVLTPIIFSPMAISALVLSPYALSPIIQSPLIAYAVILSPSYLS